MTFGERITVIRKQLKWSQEDLAKKVGTSAPIIGRYERNEIKPSIEIAKKIADELEVTVDYLLGGSDKMVLDKKTVKRMEEIEALPQKEKEKIFEYIDLIIRDTKIKNSSCSLKAKKCNRFLVNLIRPIIHSCILSTL
jgi:transcriptional regulator with XRE-family HTH domain